MQNELKEWALNYFRFRKSAMGENYEISESGEDKIELKHADCIEVVLCQEVLLKPIKFSGKFILVTFNRKANVDFLAKHWKEFCLQGLRLYFVDPKNPHKKWVISPFVHSRICDDAHLKASLVSMADAAAQVN